MVYVAAHRNHGDFKMATLYKVSVQTPSMSGPLHLNFTSPKVRDEFVAKLIEERGAASIIEQHPGYRIEGSAAEAFDTIKHWEG